jgi:hypothetical protein
MESKIITLVEQDQLRNDLVFNEKETSRNDRDFGLNDTHMYCFSTIKNTHVIDRSGYISPVRLKDSLSKVDLGIPSKKYVNKRGVFIVSYRVLRGMNTENINLYCELYEAMISASPADELLLYFRDRLKGLRDGIESNNNDVRRESLHKLRDGIEGRRITFIPDSCFLENDYVYIRAHDIYIIRAADAVLNSSLVMNVLKETTVTNTNHIEVTVVDSSNDSVYYTNIGGVVVNIQTDFDPTKESYVDIIHNSGGIERYRRSYSLDEALEQGFIGRTPADVKKTLSHESIVTKAKNELELAKIELGHSDIKYKKEKNKTDLKLLLLKQKTEILKHLNGIETGKLALDISKQDMISKVAVSKMKIEEMHQKITKDKESHVIDMLAKGVKKFVG